MGTGIAKSSIEDTQAAEIERLKAKVARLEQDNARMREALEFVRNFEGYNLDSESHKAIEQALKDEE